MKFIDMKREWERKIEEICCEMTTTTTDDGFAVFVNTSPLVDSFMSVLTELETNRNSTVKSIVLGDKNNDV